MSTRVAEVDGISLIGVTPPESKIEDEVRNAAYRIIERKGSTGGSGCD